MLIAGEGARAKSTADPSRASALVMTRLWLLTSDFEILTSYFVLYFRSRLTVSGENAGKQTAMYSAPPFLGVE